MNINVFENGRELGVAAGTAAAALIRQAISENGTANIILATGTSQFETLNHLLTEKDIDWSKVVMFHLDEYIGLPATHPASFRKYLQERFLEKAPPLKAAYLINYFFLIIFLGVSHGLAHPTRTESSLDPKLKQLSHIPFVIKTIC